MAGDCAGDEKCNAIYYKIVYAGIYISMRSASFQNQDNLQSAVAKSGLCSSLLCDSYF